MAFDRPILIKGKLIQENLAEEFSRTRFAVTEDNLAHDIKRHGLDLIDLAKNHLEKINWDNLDIENPDVRRAFRILVAAACATVDGRDVLLHRLNIEKEILSQYAEGSAYPQTGDELKRISYAIRPCAERMLRDLEESLNNIGTKCPVPPPVPN